MSTLQGHLKPFDEASGSSVRDRRAFFESVGHETNDECPTTLGELLHRQPRCERLCDPPDGTDAVPEPNVARPPTLSDDCKLVAFAFEATEPWQVSVAAGDVVQLGATPPDAEGWTECVLVTKGHARHGDQGWVPTSYLTELRENKLLRDAANRPATSAASVAIGQGGAKKYKPVTKNFRTSAAKGKKFQLFK